MGTLNAAPAFLFSFQRCLYLFIYLFIYWLRWVFVAVRRLSLVVASGGYSSLRYVDFSLRWLLLLWSTGSRHVGFSCCGMQAQQLWLVGSRAQAQQLWLTGLVAPWHVGSSWTRARTCVPCIGRRILNHCATREVPAPAFLKERKVITCPLSLPFVGFKLRQVPFDKSGPFSTKYYSCSLQ